MIRIAILAALPQEYRSFQRLLGTWHQLIWQPFPVFFQRAGGCELFLVETGMGSQQVEDAAHHVLTLTSLDLMISAGFAGSLCSELPVGQVVLADKLATWNPTAATPVTDSFQVSDTPRLAAFCQALRVRPARVLTLERPHSKAELAEVSRSIPTVIDMESTAVAETTYRRGVAFLCLRAVSDAHSKEIDWDLGAIVDSRGRVRIPKVLSTILRRPALLASFYDLWRSSRKAGQRLAQTLSALLRLPEDDLQALIRELRLLPLTPTRSRHSANEGKPTDGTEPPTP
jgi:adenosylhomocysteine nucleosidase